MSGDTRALSIRNPWAWLVVNGYKDVENRTWQRSFTGPLLIHAGKKPDVDVSSVEWAFWMAALKSGQPVERIWKKYEHEKVMGALVGKVVVEGCVSHSESPWFFGPYAFVVKEPVAWRDPVPYKGALNFFPVPEKWLEHYAGLRATC